MHLYAMAIDDNKMVTVMRACSGKISGRGTSSLVAVVLRYGILPSSEKNHIYSEPVRFVTCPNFSYINCGSPLFLSPP